MPVYMSSWALWAGKLFVANLHFYRGTKLAEGISSDCQNRFGQIDFGNKSGPGPWTSFGKFSAKIVAAASILGGMTGFGVTLLYVCMHAVLDSQTLC